ncbi:hypothetical protein HMI01_13320 [Halolactibacillus miurensis]|uniref:DUF1450 domain-containing protein n=1 Tax=Halolactibacillus miurensis TaxID=306541 RepID=A0ABQ0VTC0_9BACI|nr:hypothetical protein HMI01_13320 [Halolactibacillus miurensis]
MGTIGIIIVEICESNLLSTIETEGLLENEYPEVSVITSSCLSFCGLCRLRPFAMVNGKRIKGKDVDDALINIRAAIEEELAFYRA